MKTRITNAFSFLINTGAAVAIVGSLTYSISMDAFAEEAGESTCNSISQTAWNSCFEKNSGYNHGALNFFNNTLCMLNKGFPSAAETALCHFNKSMGMNPDKGALPLTLSKTFGSNAVVLTVEKPTEAFATTAGYDAKATVKMNGTTFMVLYWAGTEEKTKGFMISGASGMGKGPGNSKSPSYIYWDRTNADAQSVKVFVASFSSTYLGTTGAMSKNSPHGGDRAMYGEATYNSSTKAVTVQTVSIEGQRGMSAVGTTQACFKMFASGTKDGSIKIAKTNDSYGTTGQGTTSTSKDGTDMDAMVGTDASTTVNGTGNTTIGGSGLTVSFTKSCDDVRGAGGTGKPFASNDVNFSATPSDVF